MTRVPMEERKFHPVIGFSKVEVKPTSPYSWVSNVSISVKPGLDVSLEPLILTMAKGRAAKPSTSAVPEQKRLPLSAKGVITSSSSQSGTVVAPPSKPVLSKDKQSGLPVVTVPGLVIVPVDESVDIGKAISVIGKRQTSPRIKGVLLIPHDSEAQIDQETSSVLALNGIILARSTLPDLNAGAVAYGEDFLQRLERSRAALRKFMEAAA